MVKKHWKKSQTSSGYYLKEKGRLPKFIKFELLDNGKWRVFKKIGLGDRKPRTMGHFKTKAQALKYAKAYMKKH